MTASASTSNSQTTNTSNTIGNTGTIPSPDLTVLMDPVHRVLTVGAGQEYATIQAAVAASHAGDTIKINAGTYTVQDLNLSHDLTIEAAGDGPVIVTESSDVTNGLFVAGTSGDAPNITIEGLTFEGATAKSGANAAGIRYQSGNLTLIGDTFQGNQNGLLASPLTANVGTIAVQGSTFDQNGASNAANANISIGNVADFSISGSLIENAVNGSEITTRAGSDEITGNVIIEGPGNASHPVINLPNGGNTVIQGNTIDQNSGSQQHWMVSYGASGATQSGSLTVSGNVLVNDSNTGAGVLNDTASAATVSGNQTFGVTAANLLHGAGTASGTTMLNSNPLVPSSGSSGSSSGSPSSPSSSSSPSSPGTDPGNGNGDGVTNPGTTGTGGGTTNPGTTGTGGGTTNPGTTTSPGHILTVGAGGEFATIQDAVAAATSGDEIDISAGTYTVANLQITTDLTIKGVGGEVDIVAPTATSSAGNVAKGIFVVGTEGDNPNVTIEGLSFSGAKSAQSNGAGIRYQSGNLTLIDDTFSNNQDGILATPFILNTGTIIEQGITLDHNGAGDGQSHNQYIGMIADFQMTDSLAEDANVGHETKDRAENSVIENNQFIDGATGNASYALDLPDGGNALIQGNTIEKGPDASAPTMIHIGGGEQQNGGTITISDNTMIDDYVHPNTVQVVWNQTNDPNVIVQGNTFQDNTPGTILNGMGTLEADTGTTGAIPNAVQTGFASAATTVSFAAATSDPTYTFTKPDWTAVGGAEHLTVNMDKAADNVVGGSGGVSINETAGGGFIFTQAGSTNDMTISASGYVESAGNDTIDVASNGKLTANVYGNATIDNASSGTSSIVVAGNATVNEQNGYYDTYRVLTGGTLNVSGAMQNEYFQIQGGTANFSGKEAGSISGYADAGSDQAATMTITTWDNSIAPNDLTLTAGNFHLALNGGGNVDASEDSGTISLINSSDSMSFIGGSGSATVNVGSGAAHITLGSGSIKASGLTTGAANSFEVDAGSTGTLTVNDFRTGTDQLVLGAGVSIESQAYSGGALHVDLSNHGQVVLTGVHSLT